jgi:hypothetical protein
MTCKNNNTIRNNYKIYLEPELATKCEIISLKIGCKTRSKYIRYAVINQLISDGIKLSEKFKPFIDNYLRKGIAYNA